MHVYFSGIGGAGIGPLAMIAHQAGIEISGSDKQDSGYIENLKKQGISNIHIGQNGQELETDHKRSPIDWLVYSSALPKENPNHPELKKAEQLGIKATKRDEFLNHFLLEKSLKMIAVAGTHGKTTTAAMVVWAFKQLDLPISYSVGAKLSFGEMGEFNSKSEFFVYEADEYDRNFLSFNPEIAILSGIDYDHPDIYPTREDYNEAFSKFLGQSNNVFGHSEDLAKVDLPDDTDHVDINSFSLAGIVNRKDAQLVVEAMQKITQQPQDKLVEIMNRFPGISRRFERIAENIYSDYAHTPEKIHGALQVAQEVSGKNVVVVYEGLHNTRQHFIRDQLENLFSSAKKLYVVPSYLAREDESLELLTPEKLCEIIKSPEDKKAAQLDENLHDAIAEHARDGDLVLCLSAGGGNSLDEWLRQNFAKGL